jgi:hypothetical protein
MARLGASTGSKVIGRLSWLLPVVATFILFYQYRTRLRFLLQVKNGHFSTA